MLQQNKRFKFLHITSNPSSFTNHGLEAVGTFQIREQDYDDTLRIKFPHAGDNWGWTFAATQDPVSTRNPLPIGDIENHDIGPNDSYTYGHTGKQNEWAGMSATIDLYTKDSNGGLVDKICSIYYSCPWSGSIEFTIRDVAGQ